MYVSGGPYKAYSYGPCTIDLRRRANRDLLDCSHITCAVVQALKALGRSDVDDEVIERIARNLSDGDVMRYLRSVGHNVPAVGAPALLLDCLRESGSKFEARLTSIMDQLALDVGSDHPVTIPVSTSFEDICRLLSESGVKKIPVVSDGQVVGIASRSAITTYLVRRFLDQAGM